MEELGRVLIVEDDEETSAQLAAVLRLVGYDVSVASSGERALCVVASERERPDLVLVDLELPTMDGLALLDALRTGEHVVAVPALVVSGHSDPERRAACLDRGADDFLAKPVDGAELVARVRLHLRRARQLDQWRRESRIDVLTGLYNRRGFSELVARELARIQRSGGSLVLVFFDLDGFKRINDVFGHDIGDRVLQQTAGAMHASMRRGDIGGRWGGDEFVIALGAARSRSAAEVVRRVEAQLQQRCVGFGLSIRLSAGLAETRSPAGRLRSTESEQALVEALVQTADRNMYRAKRSSRLGIANREMEIEHGEHGAGHAGRR